MKCKDCIYYDKCCADDVDFEFYTLNIQEETKCHFFKDKSKFVELPCKVGDEIWVVYSPKLPANPKDKGKWFMVRDGVQRMLYGKKGFSIESWNFGISSAKEIGKTIFFTKAEAKARLKELENEQNE